MIENLVFGGCQLKGLAFIGVIKYLEELDIMKDIKNICGVSSGSIFALSVCLGFNSYELKQIALRLSLNDLKSVKSDNVFKLFEQYGFDDGSQFIKLFKIILEKKTKNPNFTFKELEKFCDNKKLLILGTNLTLCKSEVFSIDTTPDMEVCDALRISISFPLVFSKVCYNNFCYVDGGVISNYPIDFFSDLDKTLGIVVNSITDNSDISTFDQYLLRILYLLSFQKQKLLCDKYSEQTVKLVVKYELLSIKFDENTKKYLIEEGYKQFKEKFNYRYYYKQITKEVPSDATLKSTVKESSEVDKVDHLEHNKEIKNIKIEDEINSLVDEIKDKIMNIK